MVKAAILNFTYNFLYDSQTSYNVYGVIPGENTFILTYYMPIFVDRIFFYKFAQYGQGGHFEFRPLKIPPRVQALHPVFISLVEPN